MSKRIPKSKIEKINSKGNGKVKCDICKKIKRNRGSVNYGGKIYCGNCKQKRGSVRHYQSIVQKINPTYKGYSLKEALNKVYKIDYNLDKNGNVRSKPINPPKVLIGRKVKFVLVEDE